MLTTLRVKNLALVESVRLDLQPGLNVITGETGAGKSILLGALALLLGERADRKFVREGADACGAEAVFTLRDARSINELLEEFGVAPCEDDQLIIRRIVKAGGTGQNLVNDSPVTLQLLKQLGERLVDMHGPHDHQSLLRPSFQLELLDAYGHTATELAAYGETWSHKMELERRREVLAGDTTDVDAQLDLLRYRVREIEDAAPQEGEEESVLREHTVVSNAQRVLELGGAAMAALAEGEVTAFDALAAAQKHLEELARIMPAAEGWRAEARAAAVQVQELAASIQSELDRIEGDSERLDWLDQRIATYQKLKRKYGPAVADVLANLEKARARLRDLETRGEQIAAIEKELATLNAELTKRGGRLRDKRQEAAAKLAKAITRELRALGFAHGRFDVELRGREPQASGIDDVEFGFAPNAGEGMKPLRAIASSGEISRVMLATKAVLAGHDRIPLLIFDEIDANVGGETGSAVGRKLAELGGSHQVICITHLPQVAACGATHFAVTKSVRDKRTITDVERLDEEARVSEIARMLGGRDLTKVTLQHARELLART